MLTLTREAAEAVRLLAGDSPANGLRLKVRNGGDPHKGLSLEYADQPEPDDEVVERDGAAVYLDRVTARELDAERLDARRGKGGQIEFSLGHQS